MKDNQLISQRVKASLQSANYQNFFDYNIQLFLSKIVLFQELNLLLLLTHIQVSFKNKKQNYEQNYQISASQYQTIIIINTIFKKMILIIMHFLICLNFAVQIPSEDLSFKHFKEKYNITYDSQEQDLKRERIFHTNIQKLRQLNCESCGVTKFTATLQQQMDQIQNLRLPENIEELKNNQMKLKLSAENNTQLKNDSPPDSFDWRSRGVITPVKAQGTCGTCWSFATIAMCQTSLILKGSGWTTKLYSTKLSEQYLLKCTVGSSCSGGYLEYAIDKAVQRGVPYQSQFPYQPYSEKNNGICSTQDVVEISNKTRISRYYINDNQIIEMIQDGPLAIAISATGWQNYKSGIFKCRPNPKINHAVLLVGYTPNYWIIKNSWGSDFGDNGFMYVSRNLSQNCGIGVAVHSLSEKYFGKILLLLFLIFYFI